MTYRLKVSAQAHADADETYEWLAENISTAYAQQWYRNLFKHIKTLARLPRRCPLARENGLFSQEIRTLLYGKRPNAYRIVFAIHEKTVMVLYVHHCARDEIKSH